MVVQFRSAVLLVAVIAAILLKTPIVILVALVAVVLVACAKVAIPNHPKKKAVPAPKFVKIDGVGKVQWITDPRQLENKREYSSEEIADMEKLLWCDPRDWRKEGEQVVLDENKPVPSPYSAAKARENARAQHNVFCPCKKCLPRQPRAHGHASVFDPTCHECYMMAKRLKSQRDVKYLEELANRYLKEVTKSLVTPVPMVVKDSYESEIAPKDIPTYELTVDDQPVATYSAGGIVHPNERVYTDYLIGRWGRP